MLNYLSGADAEIGRRKKKSSQKKEEKKKKKETRKRKVAKIAVAPARASFLAALQVNFLKLADRMARAYGKDRSRVEAWWSKLGGDTAALKKAIEKGSKKQLGAVAAAAAFTMAAPVIIAAIQIFKDLKSDNPGDNSGDNSFLSDARKALDEDPGVDKGIANLPSDVDSGLVKGKEGEEGGSMMMPLLILGGAGVAAYALSK